MYYIQKQPALIKEKSQSYRILCQNHQTQDFTFHCCFRTTVGTSNISAMQMWKLYYFTINRDQLTHAYAEN